MLHELAKEYRIFLLFNANKVYDRQILKGIGDFLQMHHLNWNIYLSDNLCWDSNDRENLYCDGMIANCDDHLIDNLIKQHSYPIVGVGASFHCFQEFHSIPYVASDNEALVKSAFDHLCSKGLKQFALYSYPPNRLTRFAYEREIAFEKITKQKNYPSYIYRGLTMNLDNWQTNLKNLTEWLNSLPKHVGIIAVNDAKARHILQVSKQLNKTIPDECCLIGIDNEEVINYLSNGCLSTVTQGTEEMGYQAAGLLHQMLEGKTVKIKQILVPPKQIIERQSTDYRSIEDPLVIQAIHYIRNYACKKIKVEHVVNSLHLSRSNLEGRFKQEFNKTIHEVIYEEKLKHAQYLLSYTKMPLAKISEQCGYASLQYFYHLFN
ncbi:XylR family transcriptional regulator, partial [Commensalibacter sp. Nvir]|uniref:XylR family transcriptional regulator n=1 Tax=Commensalibacter sp. Nvir TaxID=3069817 RepID=UPI0030C7E9DE